MRQNYPVNEQMDIVLKVHGNLQMTGWDGPEVSVETDSHALKVDRQENVLQITVLADCKITLPAGKKVRIEKIGGNADIRDVHSNLEIQRVGGDVSAEKGQHITIQKVGGNLMARGMAGLSVERVGGDCLVDRLDGSFQVSRIGGELNGQGIESISADKVGGDVIMQAGMLQGAVNAGGDLSMAVGGLMGNSGELRAGGDVELHLSKGAAINLEIKSSNEHIELNLGGEELEIDEKHYSYSVEGSSATLTIDAGGDVTVTDEPWEDMDFSEMFSSEDEREMDDDWHVPGLEASMRAVDKAVRDSQRIAEMASATGMAAARRAEEHVRKVMERLDLTGNNFVGFAGESDQPAQTAPEPSNAAVSPGSEGVSEEERLVVLRLLQENKITLDEAEQLLDALEGQSRA